MRSTLSALIDLLGPVRSRWDRLHANALYLILNITLNSLAGFLFWLLAAHLYAAGDVGMAAAAIAALTLLSMIAGMGLSQGLVRFLPAAGSGATQMINWSLSVGTLTSMAAAAIFLAGTPVWSPGLRALRDDTLVSLFFIAFAALLTLHDVFIQIFVAFRRAEYTLYLNLAYALIRIGLVAAFAAFLESLGVLYAWACASLAAVALGGLLYVRRVYPGYRPYFSVIKPPPAVFLWFSWTNGISNLIQLLPISLLPLFVAGLLGTEKTAYFFITWNVGYLLTAPALAFSLSLFAEGSHREAELMRAVRRVLPPLFAVTGMGALVAWVLGDKFLLLYGRDYSEQGIGLLKLMALASLPAVVSNVYLAILRVRRQNLLYMAANGVLASTTVGAGYPLLLHWGISGLGSGWLLGHTLVLTMALVHLLVSRHHSSVTGHPLAGC